MMKDSLYEALAKGATLVTANQRQMASSGGEYAQRCRNQGLAVWTTPDIVPLNVWLERLWNADIQETRFVMSAAQALAVWEQVILADDALPVAEMLQTMRLARLAQQAWRTLHDWQLPWPLPTAMRHGDVGAFQNWAESYLTKCRELNAIDAARLMPLLGQGLAERQIRLPPSVIFQGFEEITPAHQSLMDVFEKSGCQVTLEALPRSDITVKAQRLSCLDRDAEIAAAAQWAKSRARLEPGSRIAVVVPDLAALRERLLVIFREIIEPEHSLGSEVGDRSAINISLGKPLTEQGCIHVALQVLELGLLERLPMASLSNLLLSANLLGYDQEWSRRSLLDLALRADGDMEVTLRWLIKRSEDEERGHYSPRLAAGLKQMRTAMQGHRQPMTAAQAVEVFWGALRAMGWALGGSGSRSLSSAEYQSVEAFRDVMTQLASLDRVLPPRPALEWFGRLRSLAQKRTFQPRGGAAAVQVLGLMEAAGLVFDHAWVMGLDDETLPAMPRPNPLLPLALQRQRDLPHATPERELAYARGLLEHLAAECDELILSHPQRDGETEALISPLLVGVPENRQFAEFVGPVRPWRIAMQANARLHELRVDPSPPLGSDEPVRGGTSLLASQAQCPFKAFAVHRLQSTTPETPDLGLDPRERGSLAHAVLEAIWRQLGDQQGLLNLSDEQRQALIDTQIAHCLDEARAHRPTHYPQQLSTLEHERLSALVGEWLELEKSRPPFRVVKLEEYEDISVADLPLKVRVDRVDALSDGRIAVWDYKTSTGKPTISAWLGDRPDEPQLPVYASFGEQSADAVGFAWLRPGETRFIGLADGDTEIPKLEKPGGRSSKDIDSWEALQQEWQQSLGGLATAFKAGIATVAPKSRSQSCQYCEQSALCRVNECLDPDSSDEAIANGAVADGGHRS